MSAAEKVTRVRVRNAPRHLGGLECDEAGCRLMARYRLDHPRWLCPFMACEKHKERRP